MRKFWAIALIVCAGLAISVLIATRHRSAVAPNLAAQGLSYKETRTILNKKTGEKFIAAISEYHGLASGQYLKRTVNYNRDGSQTVSYIYSIPDVGAFKHAEGATERQYVSPMRSLNDGVFNANGLRHSERYIRDDVFAGFPVIVQRQPTDDSDTIIEFWQATTLNGLVLKTVFDNAEASNVIEASDIVLGPQSEESVKVPDLPTSYVEYRAKTAR
ncbi:MAG: hypothetical protein WBP93_17145 [Pyrinomonadaceae bacterium]